MNNVVEQWDLVRTDEGYFGIVTDVLARCVYLANGTEAQMSVEQFAKLELVPLNVFDPDGCKATFIGLDRSTILRHRPDNPYYPRPHNFVGIEADAYESLQARLSRLNEQ